MLFLEEVVEAQFNPLNVIMLLVVIGLFLALLLICPVYYYENGRLIKEKKHMGGRTFDPEQDVPNHKWFYDADCTRPAEKPKAVILVKLKLYSQTEEKTKDNISTVEIEMNTNEENENDGN